MAQSTAQDVQTQVRRLLGLILRRPIGETENPSRASEPTWDSFKHIEIIFLLEDHFDVSFRPEELEQLHDAAEMARALERHLAA